MTTSTIDRDQVAQETAEYIATVLIPDTDRFDAYPEVTVNYVDDKRPPRSVDEIKATLLSGHCWTSWMDDRVFAAMRALHGEQTSHAALIAPGPKYTPMVHVDQYGDRHEITVKVDTRTGARTVHYDLDDYTPAQARALAADLIAAAEAAERPVVLLADPQPED